MGLFWGDMKMGGWGGSKKPSQHIRNANWCAKRHRMRRMYIPYMVVSSNRVRRRVEGRFRCGPGDVRLSFDPAPRVRDCGDAHNIETNVIIHRRRLQVERSRSEVCGMSSGWRAADTGENGGQHTRNASNPFVPAEPSVPLEQSSRNPKSLAS